VTITLELYLEHQIIRGDYQSSMGDSNFRPVDLLNYVTGDVIVLTDAWSASLHVQAPPVWVNVARVKRDQVYLVIPQNIEPLRPRELRITFVEKRPLRAVLGLGPFSITGTTYIPKDRKGDLAELEHDPTGRYFVPATQARVRSQYHPKWHVLADVLLFNHGALSYVHSVTEE
jgi:hypothetical protein